MARDVDLHLDYGAIGAIMRGGEMSGIMFSLANSIAAGVVGAHSVYVETYVSDRAGATVTVVDWDAVELERLTGRLANAARGAGLEVTIHG